MRGDIFLEDGIKYIETNCIFVVEKTRNYHQNRSIMKKILTLTLLAALLLGACEKEERQTIQEQTPNRMIALSDGTKTGASPFMFIMNMGHNSKDCKGCVMISGHYVHVNCMGSGRECTNIAAVQFQQVGTDLTAITTDTFDLTSEDFFLMPDRSLDYLDENGNRIFLNIPEQMVYRYTATLQFTFSGLFFSETAAYINL